MWNLHLFDSCRIHILWIFYIFHELSEYTAWGVVFTRFFYWVFVYFLWLLRTNEKVYLYVRRDERPFDYYSEFVEPIDKNLIWKINKLECGYHRYYVFSPAEVCQVDTLFVLLSKVTMHLTRLESTWILSVRVDGRDWCAVTG